MTTRRKPLSGNGKTRKTSVRDQILVANSDTECEPLPKRRKHIEQIAQYVRDGGELYLISTALRGPVTSNPWARRIVAASDKRVEKGGKNARVRMGKTSVNKAGST